MQIHSLAQLEGRAENPRRCFREAIARGAGGNPDDIYNELVSNLIPNAHIVPAGIVALARAQERGYSFTYVD